MRTKHALFTDVARETSVKAALVENDLAYLAMNNGRSANGITTVNVKFGYINEKFDYMVELEEFESASGNKYIVPAEEEQTWLCELEDAGIIALDYDDASEEWIISFSTKYLIARGAYGDGR